MIHRTPPTNLTENWQSQLTNLITSPEHLLDYLEIDSTLLAGAVAAHKKFPVRVPYAYANRIEKGNIYDPLLQQVLPLSGELEAVEGYIGDPLGEAKANPQRGLIHKYHGRVLLITAPQCAINCRYCFRREFDYQNNTSSRTQWEQALTYIERDNTIDEVILSGGDPLVMPDNQLDWLITKISSVAHVSRIRIHSRLPIVLPARITSKLLETFTKHRLKPIFVVHCNHPNELDRDVGESLLKIRAANVTVLNQTVLLKGINNNSDTLATLSKQLFNHGVMPYYLHLLDKVTGVAHFNVTETEAKQLFQHLLSTLPGYLVPKMVKEVAGQASKLPIV